MIRTVTIPADRLEQLVSELGQLGNSITEKGGKVTVDDANGAVEIDGIIMKITGNGPYTLIVEGDKSKSEDIEDLVKNFSRYQ